MLRPLWELARSVLAQGAPNRPDLKAKVMIITSSRPNASYLLISCKVDRAKADHIYR